MNIERKNQWLVWAVLFLLVMNFTMLATIGYHVYQSNYANVAAVNQSGVEADAGKFSGRYFRDQLQLTPTQMDQFRGVNRTFRQQAQMILSELVDKRKQMLDEMSKPNSDTVSLNRLSDEIGGLHRALKQVTYRYYLGIKQECNPEQQQKLHDIFQQIFINDLPLNYPGNRGGGQHGNRFSR
jgi:Spy/CpxP family protein refolding chaperone